MVDPSIKGNEAGTTDTRRKISNMAESLYFPTGALKMQVNNKFSLGILYDQPFGAKIKYRGNNVFVSSITDTFLSNTDISKLRTPEAVDEIYNNMSTEERIREVVKTQDKLDPDSEKGKIAYEKWLKRYNSKGGFINYKKEIDNEFKKEIRKQIDEMIEVGNNSLGTGATKVDVSAQNISLLFGYQPTENYNLYVGGVYQIVNGNVKLRGKSQAVYNGYDADFKQTDGYGWLLGFAYQIPEIALRTSITYRSEINHNVETNEKLTVFPILDTLDSSGNSSSAFKNTPTHTKITTPQSVNLDLQSGIMKDTLAFANLRWVNWRKVALQPNGFDTISKALGPMVGKKDGFNLVEYLEDQWSISTGIGRQLNEKWSGQIAIGWDSGTGDFADTLGPTKGNWNLGVGVQYNLTPKMLIAGGIQYFWLGDAKAQNPDQLRTNEYVAEFKDNTAIAYGLKLGYKF